MSAFYIHADALSKTYILADNQGEKRAVDSIDIRIKEGERVGIIGRNGAGKSTLLQMLSGIASPTSGTLDVAGKVTAIFTLGLGLREDLTGRENIVIDGELHGRTRAQTNAIMQSIIDFSELGDFIERPVRTYSTGMKARLAFSMLAYVNPEILIIDEALSVGDASFSAKATAKMRELTASGRILIVVSHSMGAINDMCTRCIWIDDGKIRMDDTPERVTAAYIEEVREADEHILLERFRHHLVNESICEGWGIAPMQFKHAVSHKECTALQTGEPTLLALRMQAPAGAECRVSVEFFRLDAVHVCINHAPQFFMADAKGVLALDLSLGALPLNHGLYAVRVIVCDNAGAVMARNTHCIEVVNPAPPKGGRPVLVSPIHIHSQRITS